MHNVNVLAEVSAGIIPTGALRHCLVYLWKERPCSALGVALYVLQRFHQQPLQTPQEQLKMFDAQLNLLNITLPYYVPQSVKYLCYRANLYFKNDPFVLAKHSS